MEISRHKSKKIRVIPEDLKISEAEWINYANSNVLLLPRNKWYTDEDFKPKYFLKKENDKLEQVELIWRAGRINISSSRMTKRAIVKLYEISQELNAYFLIREGVEYPNKKLEEAKLKMKKSI